MKIGPFFVIVFVLLAGTFTLPFGITEFYGRYQCGFYGEMTGKETKWHALDACYIKTDAGWQRWDEYKARAIASEGLTQR